MKYKVIGLMSGTSLDGLDIAFCEFRYKPGHWDYSILHAETVPYSEEWFQRLSGLPGSSASEYVSADHSFGHLLGKLTREFIEKHSIRADFIASHGHTVFSPAIQGLYGTDREWRCHKSRNRIAGYLRLPFRRCS